MDSTFVYGDSDIPLAQYVYDYFVPGGRYYIPDRSFMVRSPGTVYRYTNHGLVLAGYLVETISGIDFPRYCRDSIFYPLGMHQTSWFLADLDTGNVAMPYYTIEAEFFPYGHYGFADYPAGNLRSSVRQLAIFLLAMSQDGWFEGTHLLESATIDSTWKSQCPAIAPLQGLVWYRQDVAGYPAWCHSGLSGGVSTIVGYSPADDLGAIVLTNGHKTAVTNLIYHQLWTWATGDDDTDGMLNMDDPCPRGYGGLTDSDGDGVGDRCDNCPTEPNRWQDDSDGNGVGDACELCCDVRVGDVDGQGGDEPTIADVQALIELLFVSRDQSLVPCMAEADINRSSSRIVPIIDDITIGDVALLIDYLFIGTVADLPSCW
jgi:CubicO group peptidase (beta-lactamase class C family)